MDSNYVLKGDEFMMKGDKALKGSAFGNIFGSKGERAEKALELYKSAATQYKLGKKWEKASEAYQRCITCDQTLKSGETGDFYVESAKAISNVNKAESIQFYEKAIEHYASENRLDNASRYKKEIAQIYESEFEFHLAVKAYQEAADFFQADGKRTSEYNQMRLKVAELSTLNASGDLIAAIKIFEDIGDKYMENKLTAPSAKELYFKSCLLYLCNNDSVGCGIALERYLDKDPSFASARQYKFVVNLIKAVDNNNVQMFSDECFEFNKIIPLDKWKLNVLNKIKESMQPLQQVEDGGFR
ncbi:unnamed protein product [Paramecium sonneborni]|uniref:Alpha-soluble NSF attachment protein n=1 Tax=Paramecium sonneborni TaxID=65129 RepID=A0A8S1N9W5_9CILI|nr:unnamed protein product [Paramecium sonneborni]